MDFKRDDLNSKSVEIPSFSLCNDTKDGRYLLN